LLKDGRIGSERLRKVVGEEAIKIFNFYNCLCRYKNVIETPLERAGFGPGLNEGGNTFYIYHPQHTWLPPPTGRAGTGRNNKAVALL